MGAWGPCGATEIRLVCGVTAAILVSGILEAASTALSQFSQLRLAALVEEGRADLRPLQDRWGVLTAVMGAQAVALMLVGSQATILAWRVHPGPWALLAALALAALLIALASLLGRLAALRHPESMFLRLAMPLRLLKTVSGPLLALLVWATRPLTQGSPSAVPASPLVTEGDVLQLVEASKAQGVLEQGEAEMIHSIIEFGDTIAREVMVPRVDIAAVPLEMPLEEVVDRMIERGFSRLPVFRDSIDQVVGLVYSKDLLAAERQNRTDTPLQDLIRPAKFVPGSKTVNLILRELQQEKVAMAIVVDEYGGTEGLLTMEDILEEIVGEITDEYDPENPPTVIREQSGSALVDAKMILEDVNATLSLSLPVDEYETLGGYVYGLLGRVPAQGESIEVDGLRLEVAGVDRQRITSVRLSRLDPDPA